MTQEHLRLRISPELRLSSAYEATLIEQLRTIVQHGDARLIKQTLQGEPITKILGGRKTIFLRKPVEQHPDWDFDTGVVRRIEEDERHLTGVALGSETLILPSNHRPPLSLREVVAVVNCRHFEKLPAHIQHLVNLSWRALRQDRTVRSIMLENGVKLFLLTARDDTPELARLEARVSETLQISGLGCVSSDAYEVLQLRKMLNFQDTMRKQD